MKYTMKILFIFLCLIGSVSFVEKTQNNYNHIVLNKSKNHNPENPYIKVALLLDTSNSMNNLIDQAKAQLWDIVNDLSYAKYQGRRPSLEISVYQYGNDNLNSDEGYVKQVLPFSSDLDEISKKLFSLTTSGGYEFCSSAINTSIRQLNWDEDHDGLKLIFIAGNESFSQGEMDYKTVASMAKEKGISINTIFCGNYNEGINSLWKHAADLTNGHYMAINQSLKSEYVTPHNEQILELNSVLNNKHIPKEKLGQKKVFQQDIEIGDLSSTMIQAIKKQGQAKNYEWK